MPGLVPGIHVLLRSFNSEDVDGRADVRPCVERASTTTQVGRHLQRGGREYWPQVKNVITGL
jgi:hypothetical protein